MHFYGFYGQFVVFICLQKFGLKTAIIVINDLNFKFITTILKFVKISFTKELDCVSIVNYWRLINEIA